MKFRRIENLPPHVFAEIDRLMAAARRAGDEVVGLAFGHPGLPSPEIAADELCGAARQPTTTDTRHRGGSPTSGGPPRIVTVADSASTSIPASQVITTIGAKEGVAHLMWALVQPGDVVLVPEPASAGRGGD